MAGANGAMSFCCTTTNLSDRDLRGGAGAVTLPPSKMPRTFRKVLVANRGEIAVRVMRTLREMDIVSVAVYSDADRAALHVRSADEAYPIGPAPAGESYLRVDKIIDTAKKSGCDAHPSRLRLPEREPRAPRGVRARGHRFIGPPASAMRAMGSKTAARDKMSAAGCPSSRALAARRPTRPWPRPRRSASR